MTPDFSAAFYVLLLGAAFLMGACAGGTEGRPPASSRQATGRLDSAAAWAAYRAAVRDAREDEPAAGSGRLTPLRAGVPSLVWRGTPGASRVLVATWADCTWARGTPASHAPGDTVRLSAETWVTPVPAVRAFCRRLDLRAGMLHRRLAQRLGLPPNVAYDRFAEFWIRPAALFRPCPDPEVTDDACQREAPGAPASHRRWMERQRTAAYDGTPPYPWTRLGYTYDWAPPSAPGYRGTEGPSEYVVPAGTPVLLRRVASTDAYCQ